MAGLPSAISFCGSAPGYLTNGPIPAPEAATPATTTPSCQIGMPPAPGNAASGEQATKPVTIGGAIIPSRCRCSRLGICWVAAIQALDRALAIPPAPP